METFSLNRLWWLLLTFVPTLHANGIKETARNIGVEILNYAKESTNYDKITNEFNNLYKDGSITVKGVSGSEIVHHFKSNLEEMFRKKSDALRKLKLKVEEEDKKDALRKLKTTENKKGDELSCDYFNMNNDSITNQIDIVKSFSTSIRVNLNHSFVQVPTTIYDCKPRILEIVNWTKNLEPVFHDNFDKSDGQMSFQFYGDASGLFRVYPGTVLGIGREGMSEEDREKEKTKAGFFDARRRSWFLQACSSPKDVVLVIDISGSMLGSKSGIARITALALIDTLMVNDFFNVILIRDEVIYMIPCKKYLMQATSYNKEKMKLALKNLGKVNNITNDSLGMTEAFNILNSGSAHNRSSSNCNKIIMFISDGVESTYVAQEVFKKRNADKSVRAFTFLIGHIENSRKKESMVNMACDNRGYYYHIETLGSVWNTVLNYTQVVSRPMNMGSNNGSTLYSPIYEDAAGQGNIMTLSMGAFNKEGVIGVVGTDIFLNNMIEKIPYHKMSSLSRVLMIDNNGIVISHPNKRNESPYIPRNVYLEDIEYGVKQEKVLEIKKKMIDRVENGSEQFSSYFVYGGGKQIVQHEATVDFQPIKDTEFSSAVISPKEANWEISYKKDEKTNKLREEGINALSSEKDNIEILIAQWDYYKKPKTKNYPSNVRSYYTADELSKLLKDKDKDKDAFNEDMVRSLLVSAAIVNKHFNSNGTFVSTHGGYTKRSSSDSFNDFSSFAVPHFEYVASNTDDVVTISLNDKRKGLVLTSAVRIGESRTLMAVSGIELETKLLSDKLNKALPKSIGDDVKITFLLDRNGYIVFSTEKDIGKYIGKLFDGEFSKELVKVGVFKKVTVENVQSECDKGEGDNNCTNSNSNFLLSPFRLIFGSFYHIFRAVVAITVQYSLFLSSIFYPTVESSETFTAAVTISCKKVVSYYLLQDDFMKSVNETYSNNFTIDSQYEINYEMSLVPQTNLLLLTISYSKDCEEQCIVTRDDLESSMLDSIDYNQRYRRPPRGCSNQTESDKLTAKCGRAHSLAPPFFIFHISILLWWIVR